MVVPDLHALVAERGQRARDLVVVHERLPLRAREEGVDARVMQQEDEVLSVDAALPEQECVSCRRAMSLRLHATMVTGAMMDWDVASWVQQ